MLTVEVIEVRVLVRVVLSASGVSGSSVVVALEGPSGVSGSSVVVVLEGKVAV